MAWRNSQRALRSSRSFSRLIAARASGTASPVKITRMAVATINSMSVNPNGPRAEAGFRAADFIRLLSSKTASTLRVSGVALLRPSPALRSRVLDHKERKGRKENRLLHCDRGHSPGHGHGLHRWITRSAFRDGQSGLSASLGQEGQSDYGALPGDAGRSRWPGGGDLQRSRRVVVAMHQRDPLG